MSDELFPPRPGGLVDTQRREQTPPAELPTTVEVLDGPVPYSAVRVRNEAADQATARTLTLSAANPVLRVFGRDAGRRSAVLIAVDADVYLTNDQGVAWQVQGAATAEGAFYLPKGLVVPVSTQGELWAAATTTAANSRVSVLIAADSNP